MFDSKEIAERALARAEIIKQERAARKRKIYNAVSVAACLLLIVGMSFIIPKDVPDSFVLDTPGAVSATLLAGEAIGGYVLIGVIGFVLGVAVTVFCMKKARKD